MPLYLLSTMQYDLVDIIYVGMVQGAYMSPGHTQLAELAQQQANDIAFDPSAISILDEAVTLGVLPAIKYVFCVPAATQQPTHLLVCILLLLSICSSSSSLCLLWVTFVFVLPAALCSSSSSILTPTHVNLFLLFLFLCLLCCRSSSSSNSS